MKTCHACKKELAVSGKAGRRDVCPSCRADLCCCLNCAFYDQQASKQCREPVAELVKDKDRANFCDFFRFADSEPSGRETAAEHARKDLDALFKRQ